MDLATILAFRAELAKEAAPRVPVEKSTGMSRAGRRPLRASTLLKKDKDGEFGWKLGAPRAVREWQRLQGAGDAAGADQIAQAYGGAGLNQRYLKNVSGGGGEAAVDLMMGRAQGGQNESGYVAKKLYKPDSQISQGEQTSRLLAQKQDATDTMRAISPEAKAMTPAMYGHRTIGSGDQLRHISEHEYVPGATPLRSSGANTPAALQQVEKTVGAPMAQRGQRLGDVGYVEKATGQVRGNVGNVAMTPQGPKVLDFIPQGRDKAVTMDRMGENVLNLSTPGASQYGGGNMNALRREVHRPTQSFEAPVQLPAHMEGRVNAALDAKRGVPSPPPLAQGVRMGTGNVPKMEAATRATSVGTAVASPAAARAATPAAQAMTKIEGRLSPAARAATAIPGRVPTALANTAIHTPAARAAAGALAHKPSLLQGAANAATRVLGKAH